MEKTALIFIPDISGFTEFVTKTEIRHSNHIISELIEVILNANQLGLQVSEIEGDAVLFYRKGDPPKLEELISQVKKMFIDFHTQLKIIQRDNVCQCGACRTAANLTLKFVTHYGVLNETPIQNFIKIMGSDVILAHRLLKNSLVEKEYLLITDKYFKVDENTNLNPEPWIEFKPHKENFKNFEDVNLKYTSLTPVKNEVPDVSELKKPQLQSKKHDFSIFIKAPILLVHELLSDSDAKMDFVPGLKGVSSSSPINRINASHTCVFEDLEIHFVTQLNESADGEIRYVEEGEVSNGLEFISDYKLTEAENGTILSVRTFPKFDAAKNRIAFNKVLNGIKKKLIKLKLKSTSRKNLQLFKEYCERIAVERSASNKN